MYINGSQGVILHAVTIESLDTLHHAGKGRIATCIYSMCIVDTLRTIYRDTDKKVVVAENCAPLVIDKQSVGLYRVFDRTTLGIPLLQRHSLTKKLLTGKQRLATVPRKGYNGRVVALDICADIVLEQSLIHLRLAVVIECRLIEVVAVLAAHIAQRADGLNHRGKAPSLIAFYNIFVAKFYTTRHYLEISTLNGSYSARWWLSSMYPHIRSTISGWSAATSLSSNSISLPGTLTSKSFIVRLPL